MLTKDTRVQKLRTGMLTLPTLRATTVDPHGDASRSCPLDLPCRGMPYAFKKKRHVTQRAGACKERLHWVTVLPKNRQHFEQFAPRQLSRPFFAFHVGSPVHCGPSSQPDRWTFCLLIVAGPPC